MIIYLKKVDSTNEFSKTLIDRGYKKCVILADIQTKGKGRLGRCWISNYGGLYFSIIDEPLYIYPILIPVCIIETLKLGRIKFPNDIIVKNKKLSGVLIENYKNRAIIGVGINVYNKVDLDTAISLKDLNIHYDKVEILKNFLNIYNKYLEKFKKKEIFKFKILRKYKRYSCSLNKNVKLILPNKTVFGRVVDIDFEGITLRTKNGLEKYPTGEIVHLRDDDTSMY